MQSVSVSVGGEPWTIEATPFAPPHEKRFSPGRINMSGFHSPSIHLSIHFPLPQMIVIGVRCFINLLIRNGSGGKQSYTYGLTQK